jgi:hypothetical protein
MERIIIIGLCFAAVSAFGALGVASASATIEGLLVKEPVGGFPASFTSRSLGGGLIHETVSGRKVECTSETGTGTFETAHLGKVTVKVEGCFTKISLFTLKCYNIGASEEEREKGLITVELGIHLGVELAPVGTPHDAVLFLILGSKPGKFEFECTSAARIDLEGELIGLIQTLEGGVIKPATKYPSLLLLFTKAAEGVQSSTIFHLALVSSESAGLMEKVHLTTSLNKEAAEETSQEGKIAIEKFKAADGQEEEVEFERTPEE